MGTEDCRASPTAGGEEPGDRPHDERPWTPVESLRNQVVGWGCAAVLGFGGWLVNGAGSGDGSWDGQREPLSWLLLVGFTAVGIGFWRRAVVLLTPAAGRPPSASVRDGLDGSCRRLARWLGWAVISLAVLVGLDDPLERGGVDSDLVVALGGALVPVLIVEVLLVLSGRASGGDQDPTGDAPLG